MIRAAGTIIALTLAVVPALGQDRPPDAPQTDGAQTEQPDAERPPERPDVPEPAPRSDDPAADTPADQPSGPPAPTESALDEPATDQPAAQPIGPPPPPVWFTLSGTDAQYDACRLALSVMGAQFRPQPPVTDPDNRDCGIARPLQVSRILPDVALSGEPVMRCEAALSLALWTRDFLQPAAGLLPDTPRLTALETGPAYSCRDRVGTGDADPKPSEHGYGNAIDVMGFRFGDGEPVLVQPRQGDGDAAESFQRAAQSTGCLLFTTVLGPGSNAAHDDHLHLDIAARNGGWRLCE